MHDKFIVDIVNIFFYLHQNTKLQPSLWKFPKNIMHGTKRYHNTGPMGQNQWWKVAQLSVTLCNEKWFGSNHSNWDP